MLSLPAASTCTHHVPFVFPFLILINPTYTHVFCLGSSMRESKDHLLKTLFAINITTESGDEGPGVVMYT
jgi:hypothetical protein